jgi:hypothetical protein
MASATLAEVPFSWPAAASRHERHQRRLELRTAGRDQITVTNHTRDDGRSGEPGQ